MSDTHLENEMVTQEMEMVIRERMYSFIFPNTPNTKSESIAFENAVLYQCEHEASQNAMTNGVPIPEGTQSFSIGDFSMSFKDGQEPTGSLSKCNICPAAYSVLLRAGLLYRGV